MWVKPNQPNVALQIFFSAGTGVHQRMYLALKEGKWDMAIFQRTLTIDTVPSPVTATNADWNNIALVMNGTSALLYVNGEFSFSVPYSSYNYSNNLVIGSHTSGYWFNGLFVY